MAAFAILAGSCFFGIPFGPALIVLDCIAGGTVAVCVGPWWVNLAKAARDHAELMATVADELNSIWGASAVFCDIKDADLEDMRLPFVHADEDTDLTWTRFDPVIDAAFRNNHDTVVGATAAGVLQKILLGSPDKVAAWKHVFPLLEKNLCWIRGCIEFPKILAEAVSICRQCSPMDAKQIHGQVLSLLFKETHYGDDVSSRVLNAAFDFLLSNFTPKMREDARTCFEIRDFNDVNVGEKLDALHSFLTGGKITSVQFQMRFNSSARKILLRNRAYPMDFDDGCKVAHGLHECVLRHEFGYAIFAEHPHAIEKKVAALEKQFDGADGPAAVTSYFTDAGTSRTAKALIRNCLRHSPKDVALRLIRLIDKCPKVVANDSHWLKIYKFAFISRMPHEYREKLAAALGRTDAEILEMRKTWLAEEELALKRKAKP
jgi:hypothetical protein